MNDSDLKKVEMNKVWRVNMVMVTLKNLKRIKKLLIIVSSNNYVFVLLISNKLTAILKKNTNLFPVNSIYNFQSNYTPRN